MADRYWVGGTESWDGTAGTKWATTSGGAGGASVPTSADDVFFTNLSTGTCTIAAGNTGAKSINCTGFTGTITGIAAITISGSITLVAGMTYTHTGTVTINATATLTTAGKTFSALTVNGSGITVTLGDALNISTRALIVTQGTFTTSASNYSVTAGLLSSNNNNTRTISFNGSTVTLANSGPIDFATSTNLTFNAGTSQINLTSASALLVGGGQTFYNVTFTNTSSGTRAIENANTFNNLTLSNNTASALVNLRIADNQTVNGTFSCAGAGAIRRSFVFSSVLGTSRTITAAAVTATDCDFRDITIAGAAAPISPTRAGNCGGNSGITFPAAKTVYRVGTNSSWQGSNSWALTSGGTGSDNNFPLAQDTGVIDDATTLTGTLFISINLNNGALDCSTRTTALTLQYNLDTSFYGSNTFGSGITIAGSSTITFFGRGTQTFTSAGKTITFPIIVNSVNGSFELGDAFNSSSSVTFTNGTFDAKNYNFTCTSFSSNNANVRTITMGSGLWTLTNSWSTQTSANLTLNKDTANILLTGVSFQGGTIPVFNKVTVSGSATSVQFSNSGNIGEIASTKTIASSIRFNTGTYNITTWSASGTVGNLLTVNSTTTGTRRTLNLTNSTAGLVDYLSVQDIGISSPNLFYVGNNSIDGGNNLNVYFIAFPASGNFFLMF